MSNLTTFRGIATLTEFEGQSIIITAGDIDTLKAYLGQQGEEGHPEICNVAITLGPRAEIALPSMAGLLAAKAFAEKIDGREYGFEIKPEEEAEAKAAGLVVVFGASDDLAEFRGAIRDEAGLGDIRVTTDGKFVDDEIMDTLTDLVDAGVLKELPKFKVIHHKFDDHHRITTEIPHARFTVNEDGEKFSDGIVFHLSDLTA